MAHRPVAILLWLIRRDEDYRLAHGIVGAYGTMFAGFCAIYFYGVFSPAPVVLSLGVFIYCTGQSLRASAIIYASCALAYAALSSLVLAGVLVDRGIVRGEGTAFSQRATMAVMVEIVLFAVYIVARNLRATTLAAIERHDVVVRNLAMRDALLREARNELVQVMRVGGIGRFSGEVVGSFRLGSVIGQGAMGEVYEAEMLDTKQPAAVKLVHPHFLGDREIVERFLREARITSSLESPNVVRVLETSPADAPIPYLAMERLVGEDLATILREQRRLGTRRLVTMLRHVAAGLDAAHAAGIVHRDLKPRNIFCARSSPKEEVWKILDFGVSKLQGTDGTLTKDHVVGTPSYMSPEQALGREVGPCSDIFALGVNVYRALTGSPAFTGETTVDILFRIASEMPLRPSSLVDAPEEVDLVLGIALAKDPRERFTSAAAFADAFEAATRRSLSPHLAARARSLLAKAPWSTPGSARTLVTSARA
jgi:tRNA A-37 threonylcarbamoyl transferase component Bud32